MGYAVAPTAAEEIPIFRNGLAQNYPNPFNPATTIVFSLKERSHLSIRVYNVLGQLVRVLADEERDAGIYTDVKWNGLSDTGTRVASGIYFCRMVTKNFVETKKMVLLK
jgi:flagellar hook assembly protein FlgD